MSDGFTVVDHESAGDWRKAFFGRTLPWIGTPPTISEQDDDLSGKDLIVAPEYAAHARKAFPQDDPKSPRVLVCKGFEDPTSFYLVDRDAVAVRPFDGWSERL